MGDIINALLVGGVGVAIVNAVARGFHRRSSAHGRSESRLDAALRSRHNWMSDDYRVRDIATHAGCDLPALPPDPYADLMKENHEA